MAEFFGGTPADWESSVEAPEPSEDTKDVIEKLQNNREHGSPGDEE